MYFLKTIFHITPLPPHNSNLSTMTTFFCPQGAIVERFNCNNPLSPGIHILILQTDLHTFP